MKKFLFITNFTSKTERSNVITSFSRAAYLASRELGWEFHINVNYDEEINREIEDGVKVHKIEVYRNPFSKEVIIGYKQLMKVLHEEQFDIIHCNTPIGGVLGRICGRKAGVPVIIYQAHGFHFYKGSSKKNWLMFYPIEKILAKMTDVILTMNHEDYLRAKSFKLRHNGKVINTKGVGIDLSSFNQIKPNRNILREKLGIKEDEIACISMGDLIPRKNYKVAIDAVSKCSENVHYFICGRGDELESLQLFAKEKNVENRIHFLGYRTDVKELLSAADIFLFTTLQEGMPRSMMEAMASGLPCIASNIRGNVDLLQEGKGGFLLDVDDVNGIAQKIILLSDDANMRKRMSENNLQRIKAYDISEVKKDLLEVYQGVIKSE